MFLKKSKLLSNLNIFVLDSKNNNIPFTTVSASKVTIIGQLLCMNRKHLFRPSFRASLSVEAAVVLPIVVCFTVFVMIFFRILAIEWGVHIASVDVARKMAIVGNVSSDNENIVQTGIGTAGLVAMVQAQTIADDVPVKFIVGDNIGINLMESEVSDMDIDIRAKYLINAPTNMFGLKLFNVSQRTKVRRWVGYDPHEGEDDEEYVFVTEHGVAYHSTLNCVYLNPSISAVSHLQIEEARNASGGKYYECENCGGSAAIYYITEYGTAYHTTVTCQAFSRSIRRETIEKAIGEGYHSCSKCG